MKAENKESQIKPDRKVVLHRSISRESFTVPADEELPAYYDNAFVWILLEGKPPVRIAFDNIKVLILNPKD